MDEDLLSERGEAAAKVHGITDAKNTEAPNFKRVWARWPLWAEYLLEMTVAKKTDFRAGASGFRIGASSRAKVSGRCARLIVRTLHRRVDIYAKSIVKLAAVHTPENHRCLTHVFPVSCAWSMPC